MSTQYIDRTGSEMWALSSRDLCPWCATEDVSGCLARYCDSCSADWLSTAGDNGDGEGRPLKQTCPDCMAEGFGTNEEYAEQMKKFIDCVKASVHQELARHDTRSPEYLFWLNTLAEVIFAEQDERSNSEKFLVAMRRVA